MEDRNLMLLNGGEQGFPVSTFDVSVLHPPRGTISNHPPPANTLLLRSENTEPPRSGYPYFTNRDNHTRNWLEDIIYPSGVSVCSSVKGGVCTPHNPTAHETNKQKVNKSLDAIVNTMFIHVGKS